MSVIFIFICHSDIQICVVHEKRQGPENCLIGFEFHILFVVNDSKKNITNLFIYLHYHLRSQYNLVLCLLIVELLITFI